MMLANGHIHSTIANLLQLTAGKVDSNFLLLGGIAGRLVDVDVRAGHGADPIIIF